MASKQFNTPSEAHAEGTLFLLLTIPCGCPTSFVRVFPYSDSALSGHYSRHPSPKGLSQDRYYPRSEMVGEATQIKTRTTCWDSLSHQLKNGWLEDFHGLLASNHKRIPRTPSVKLPSHRWWKYNKCPTNLGGAKCYKMLPRWLQWEFQNPKKNMEVV